MTGSPNQQPEFVDNRDGNTLERAFLAVWNGSPQACVLGRGRRSNSEIAKRCSSAPDAQLCRSALCYPGYVTDVAPAQVVSPRTAARIAASVASKGIYTVPSVARVLHEDNRTIDRWALGYTRRGKRYEPAITTDVPAVAEQHVLTFLELVELMFIQAALKSGLSWPKVRDASRVAARLLKDEPHPFASKRWFADPAGLYLKLGEENEEEILVEVAGHAQVSMEPILAPYLTQLVFDLRGVAQQWYPNGIGCHIVLDPRRAFGQPVTSKGGIPTDTIAALYSAGDSVESIAAWFRTDETEIAAAIAYERGLSKAA